MDDDTLVLVEVIFPRGDGYQHIGEVIKRKRGHGVIIKWRHNEKTILDKIEYVVQNLYVNEDTLEHAKAI